MTTERKRFSTEERRRIGAEMHEMVQRNASIRTAGNRLGLAYSTAKDIYRDHLRYLGATARGRDAEPETDAPSKTAKANPVNVQRKRPAGTTSTKSPAADPTAQLLANLAAAQQQQAEMLQRLINGEAQPASDLPTAGQPPIEDGDYERKCDSSENTSILLISDMHAPYQHPDTYDFLEGLHNVYGFDRIICQGDELDYHAMSYHESDPDLPSAGAELEAGREFLHKVERLFPEVDLVDSNHGSMAYRRQKTAGMPRHLIHSYRNIVFGEKDKHGDLRCPGGRGHGWRWHPQLRVRIPNSDVPLTVVHGLATDARNAMRRLHTHVSQGHYHTEFHIRYEAGPNGMLFGLTAGCLIDDSSLAYGYNKVTPARPAIGCAGIIDGVPRLFPMIRDSRDRWIGIVP